MSLKKTVARDTISREPASEEEIQAIVSRLHTTHTKSGQECKQMDELAVPGYGLKMYPKIDGIETRFKGKKVSREEEDSVIARLHSAKTKAYQAKLDNPKILLYPERTTLMNDFERIVSYQETGAVVKQNMMARREKWYN